MKADLSLFLPDRLNFYFLFNSRLAVGDKKMKAKSKIKKRLMGRVRKRLQEPSEIIIVR